MAPNSIPTEVETLHEHLIMTLEASPSMGMKSDSMDSAVAVIAAAKPLTVTQIVNARRVIDGPSDKLRAVSAQKYPWVRSLWAKMRVA